MIRNRILSALEATIKKEPSPTWKAGLKQSISIINAAFDEPMPEEEIVTLKSQLRVLYKDVYHEKYPAACNAEQFLHWLSKAALKAAFGQKQEGE